MLAADASRTIDLDGHTHYLDLAGPDGAPPLVCVHGLGGSHVNWTAVAPSLAARQRVYLPDLAGHGLTFPDHRRTDVDSNQRLLDRFLREVVDRPVVLMGNSMGGMISILQAARNPETVRGLVLVAPAIPGPVPRPDAAVALKFAGYALPGVANVLLSVRRRRLTPAQQVQEVLDTCCVDTDRVPRDLIERQVAVATRRQSVPGIDAAFLGSARSVMTHLIRRRELLDSIRAIGVPVLLLQGDRDRLVDAGAAHLAAAARPDWDFRIAEGVGHVPQMETPDWTLEQYRQWIDSTGLLTDG